MILPSSKDWEQSIRAEKLEKMGILRLLQPEHLQPESLASQIVQAIDAPCTGQSHKSFELQGAQKTTSLLKTLMAQAVVAV
jgi:predicted glycosyltransferase